MLYQLSYLGTLVFRIVALRVIIIERHLSNSEQIRVSRLAYELRAPWPVQMSFEPSEKLLSLLESQVFPNLVERNLPYRCQVTEAARFQLGELTGFLVFRLWGSPPHQAPGAGYR